MKEAENSDSVYLQESSLLFVVINFQDAQLKPTNVEILALQAGANAQYQIRFKVRLGTQNIRKLIRSGDNLVGFGPKDYFVFDSSLKILSQRSYQSDLIEGKFSNLGQSYDMNEMMLLFAGIYFTKLVPSSDKASQGSLCLV